MLLHATPCAQTNGRDLLTPRIRASKPSQKRFRARPFWACLEPCPVSESAGLASHRQRFRIALSTPAAPSFLCVNKINWISSLAVLAMVIAHPALAQDNLRGILTMGLGDVTAIKQKAEAGDHPRSDEYSMCRRAKSNYLL